MNLQDTINQGTVDREATIEELRGIAHIIKDQIGINTAMCIGFKNPKALPCTDLRRGGLMFGIIANPNVRTGGTVVVELMPSDTYKVSVFQKNGELVDSNDDIYCDALGDSILRITG